MWSKCVSKNVCGDSRLPLPAFKVVAGKILKGKFKPKIGFPIENFMLPAATIIDADNERLKSLHTLFDKY